jgi:hypothetical protein
VQRTCVIYRDIFRVGERACGYFTRFSTATRSHTGFGFARYFKAPAAVELTEVRA